MPSIQPSAETGIAVALTRSIHDHWRVFLAEGIALCLLGCAAIILPRIAGLAATVVLGWLFLIAGLVGLFATLRARNAPGFGWALFSALIAIVAGVILLWSPMRGLITLTLVMIVYFIADGLINIGLAVSHRSALSGRWEWMLVNGIVDLVLAGIVISGLPGTLFWALGLLVGIDLIFGGASLVGMALEARTPKSA